MPAVRHDSVPLSLTEWQGGYRGINHHHEQPHVGDRPLEHGHYPRLSSDLTSVFHEGPGLFNIISAGLESGQSSAEHRDSDSRLRTLLIKHADVTTPS